MARALRSAGLLVTLDYLGEETGDAQRAAATAAQYVHLLGKLAAEGLTEDGAVEVSVKPTALGLLLGSEDTEGPTVIGERVAAEHLERIAVAAREAGTTVTVDAEDHRMTDASLRIATALRDRSSRVLGRQRGAGGAAAHRGRRAGADRARGPGTALQGRLRRAGARRRSRPSMTSTGRSRAACGS